MAFLSGYTKRWEYKIPASKVPSTQTDYPVYVDLSDMPASFWSTVSASGGDIRVTRSDGTTECAREVVSCATATDTGELHFLANSVDGTTDTVFYIYANGTSADYTVTDTYGRNAVWGDYLLVAHLSDNTDSTGNTTLTNTSVDFSAGQIGNGGLYNSASDRISAGTNATMEIERTDSATFQSWVRRTNANNNLMVFSRQLTSGTFRGYALYTGSSNGGLDFVMLSNGTANGFISRSSAIIADVNTWYSIAVTYDGSSNPSGVIQYRNGASFTTTNPVNTLTDTIVPSADYLIGNRSTTLAWSNLLDEQRVRKSALSANWITTEYNNQSDHSTFATIGAEETDGGGGGATFNNFKGFAGL